MKDVEYYWVWVSANGELRKVQRCNIKSDTNNDDEDKQNRQENSEKGRMVTRSMTKELIKDKHRTILQLFR